MKDRPQSEATRYADHGIKVIAGLCGAHYIENFVNCSHEALRKYNLALQLQCSSARELTTAALNEFASRSQGGEGVDTSGIRILG